MALALATGATGCANGRMTMVSGAITFGVGATGAVFAIATHSGSAEDHTGELVLLTSALAVLVGGFMMLGGAVQTGNEHTASPRGVQQEVDLERQCDSLRSTELALAQVQQDPALRARSFHAVRTCDEDAEVCRSLRSEELLAARGIADDVTRTRELHAARQCSDHDARARGQEYRTFAECEEERREQNRRALAVADRSVRGALLVAAPACDAEYYAPSR